VAKKLRRPQKINKTHINCFAVVGQIADKTRRYGAYQDHWRRQRGKTIWFGRII